LRHSAFAHALHFENALARRRDGFGEAAEMGDQSLGERF